MTMQEFYRKAISICANNETSLALLIKILNEHFEKENKDNEQF